MEKEFVPYELALKLKELGFGSKGLDFYLGCFAYYGNEASNLKGKLIPNNTMMKHSKFNYSEFIMAPLWQQAFDWFRKEYSIKNYIYDILEDKWVFSTWEKSVLKSKLSKTYHSNYEEARLECLKKLIEIKENEKLSKD